MILTSLLQSKLKEKETDSEKVATLKAIGSGMVDGLLVVGALHIVDAIIRPKKDK